jgi:phage/plasmid-like protein (TIGR03299 family)
MAHELEINETTGETAFALRGEPAWHGLGTVFEPDAHVTTAGMLELAHLNNWNVRLEAIPTPEGYTMSATNQLVVRDNPFDKAPEVLAVVGDRYNVVQNEQLFDFADGILDGSASWESAGSIKGGKVIFGSLAIDREFALDPKGANDVTKTYLLVTTSHDGSTSVSANITPVRVVCQNTLNMALRHSTQSFKIRHTSTVDGKIAIAREALNLTFEHMDEFETMARQLFETEVTKAQFDALVANLYPEPEDDASKVAQTRYNQKVDLMQYLYTEGATNANIKGTAWGALNALTEYIDYYREGRNGSEAIIGAASGFDPVVNKQKNRILDAVLALA